MALNVSICSLNEGPKTTDRSVNDRPQMSTKLKAGSFADRKKN